MTTPALTAAARHAMVRLSKRSWWAVLYRNGTELYEWGTLVNSVLTPLGIGRTSRWEEIPKDGMISVRLFCPNGTIGELWGRPQTFFQYKSGYRFVTFGSVLPDLRREAAERSHCEAHVIGVLLHADGTADCYAWEVASGCLLR
jgi:hypothetical protein